MILQIILIHSIYMVVFCTFVAYYIVSDLYIYPNSTNYKVPILFFTMCLLYILCYIIYFINRMIQKPIV